MPRGLPNIVRENLQKACSAATAAVEVYNKPGPHFRAAHYIVLMTMAWTALFHAVFYRRRVKPWYTQRTASGRGIRYQHVEGEPKHWDLSECLKQYYADQHPAVRQNLRFILGLRNKIEHRNLPELDPALYGECQSMLMNFEAMLVDVFGDQYSLTESLAVSLQFSHIMPAAKSRAVKRLVASAVKHVKDYIQTFRAGLSPEVLNSTEYSFSVYLVPKVANRENAGDIAVEFVRYDPTKPEEMKNLEQITSLIKEKQVPVANLGLKKPGQVVDELRARISFPVNAHVHTCAWRHYKVRPQSRSSTPKATTSQFCVYDDAHGDYLYTDAWVEFLAKNLGDAATYQQITGRPVRAEAAKSSRGGNSEEAA